MSPIGPNSRRMLNQSTQTSAASLQRLVDLRPREDGARAVLPKSPLWSPERYDRADSKAAAAAKGVPNGAVVRNPCITAMLYLCQEGQKSKWLS